MGTDDTGTPETVGSVVLATAGTALLGAGAHLADVSPWGAAVFAAPAVVHAVKTHVAGKSALTSVYTLGCWAGCGAWIGHAAASANGPWTWNSFLGLAAGAVTAGLLSPVTRWRDKAVAEKRARWALRTAKAKRIAEWRLRLQHVCGLRGHRVLDVFDWGNGYGYTVRVSIVGTKTDWRRLRQYEVRLATDADLPDGCGVEIAKGPSRGTVDIRVSTRDAFVAPDGIPLPTDDLSVRSSNEPISLGWCRDGTRAEVSILRQRWIMVAPPDQGKTNELHTVTAGALLTNDSLVRMIDCNGGGLAWPWLRAFIAGKVKTPAIDWVAPNYEEAARLAADTLWEAKRRKRAYQHLLVDDDKLPPGDGRGGNPPPNIVLIVDEGAEVGGAADSEAARSAARDIATIIRIGRSVGVTVIQCYLRATIDMTGGTANKRLSGTRILKRVQDPVEAQHLFGQLVDPDDAPYPGCGWFAEFGQTPRPYRGWRTVGATIDTVAIATADRRPVAFPSPNYAGRWDRIQMPSQVDAPAPEPVPTTTGGGSRLDQLRAIRDRMRERRGDIRHDPDLAARFDDVIKGMELPAAEDRKPRLDVGARMIQVVREAGTAGISGDGVLRKLTDEGYKVARASLYRWLGAAEELTLTDRGFVHRDNLTG